VVGVPGRAHPQEPSPVGKTSYSPVDQTEPFDTVKARMSKDKAAVMARQKALLEERYDLSDKPSDAKMFRGKPVQGGVRAKPAAGGWFANLSSMPADEIRDKGAFPKGFLPLPHANHPEGGMIFPKFHIDEVKKQTGRDLARFDLDFDLPDLFLPEFPPP